jgi:DNA replication protein DnaC
MSGLKRNRRAIVYGGPGTGKTVLAVEQACRLSAEGFSVLLTCFNRPLAEAIGKTIADRQGDDRPRSVLSTISAQVPCGMQG